MVLNLKSQLRERDVNIKNIPWLTESLRVSQRKPFISVSTQLKWFRKKKLGSVPRDIELRLCMCGQLLQRQKRKRFLHRDEKRVIPSAESHEEKPEYVSSSKTRRQGCALYIVRLMSLLDILNHFVFFLEINAFGKSETDRTYFKTSNWGKQVQTGRTSQYFGCTRKQVCNS